MTPKQKNSYIWGKSFRVAEQWIEKKKKMGISHEKQNLIECPWTTWKRIKNTILDCPYPVKILADLTGIAYYADLETWKDNSLLQADFFLQGYHNIR